MLFGIKEFDSEYQKAIEFAVDAHGDQMYGNVPYVMHLVQVSQVLVRYGFGPWLEDDYERARSRRLILAAILHDVIEDTHVTREEVAEVFGDDVALLVYAVSNEPGKNRRERHAKSHGKIIEIKDAIILKLADRIANIEHCHTKKKNLLGMYRKEWSAFKAKLQGSTNAPAEMWEYLERLIAR